MAASGPAVATLGRVIVTGARGAEAQALIPMRRVGKPAGVAGIIEWLTPDDASYATGGYFAIDGGQTWL
jgi:NAD(P)-dependent dehydrogenase (short-subunit alcohol dehydrogenase family)